MESDKGRFFDDAASLRALVGKMPKREQEAYDSFLCLGMESVFPNRRMFVYDLGKRGPENVEVIHFEDLEMNRIDGPRILARNPAGPLILTPVPCRYEKRELFLHVPQNFVYKYKGKKSATGVLQFAPHFAVLYKTRSREHDQIPGHTYIATKNKFRERFPTY